MSPTDPFEPAVVRDAVARSVLGGLTSSLVDEVLEEAVRAEVPAGRAYRDAPLGLVIAGLFRVAVSSGDGRQLTVAYLHSGDVLGLAALAGRRFPVIFEAVTDIALRLSRDRFDELRRSQPSVATAVSDQLALYIDDILDELTLAGFGRVRQRIIRHLLALAEGCPGVRGRCAGSPIASASCAPKDPWLSS